MNPAKFKKMKSILLTVWLLFVCSYGTIATSEEAKKSLQIVSADILNGKLKEVEASSSLSEETKKKLTENYLKALTHLEQAASYEANAASFSEARTASPIETEKLRATLTDKQKQNAAESLRLADDTSLTELEQLLQKEKADLAAVDAKLSDLNNRLDYMASRPTAAREQLITAGRKQETLFSSYDSSLIQENESPALTQAHNWVQTSKLHALSAEIKMLDKELLSLQPLTQLLQVKQEITEQDSRYIQTRIRLLEDMVSKLRLSEAQQVQQETLATQEEFRGKHPLISELADKNVALGNEIQKSALKLEKFSAEDDAARNNARRIDEELSTIRQKLEIAGLSQALGQVLMEQRRLLPNLASIQKQARNREDLIAESSLRQIQYAEESRNLRDVNAYFASLTISLADHEVDEIESELLELIIKRQELLQKARKTEASYLRILGELDLAQRQLIDAIDAYDTFLASDCYGFVALPRSIFQCLIPCQTK